MSKIPFLCGIRVVLSGQYHDKETGLYDNLNRYYDPKIGRYLQTDPAGDGLNPYLYAASNPVNAIDPDGLCALRMFGGASEMLVGAALIPGTGFIGTVAGIMVILNGMDNLIAGARSLDGEYRPALLEAGINRVVPNQFAASLVYMGTQIAIPWGGMKLAQWDRARRVAQAYQTALKVNKNVDDHILVWIDEEESLITLAEAKSAARKAGIDMRMFELVYEPGTRSYGRID